MTKDEYLEKLDKLALNLYKYGKDKVSPLLDCESIESTVNDIIDLYKKYKNPEIEWHFDEGDSTWKPVSSYKHNDEFKIVGKFDLSGKIRYVVYDQSTMISYLDLKKAKRDVENSIRTKEPS